MKYSNIFMNSSETNFQLEWLNARELAETQDTGMQEITAHIEMVRQELGSIANDIPGTTEWQNERMLLEQSIEEINTLSNEINMQIEAGKTPSKASLQQLRRLLKIYEETADLINQSIDPDLAEAA